MAEKVDKEIVPIVETETIDSFENDEISACIKSAYSTFSTEKPFNVEQCQELMLTALPDTVLLKIFSNLSHPELCRIALVCKHWLWIVYDSELWKFVDLSKCNNIKEEHILNLIQIRLSPLLKTLDLSNCGITPVIFHELTDNCQQLNNLVLQNCDLQVREEDRLSLLSVPENLIRLDVRNFKAGFRFMHVILEAQDMSQLECFGFGNNHFCPSFTDFQVIFSKMHSLRILECVDCESISDAQVRIIADKLKLLESLVLKKCRNISGSALPYLLTYSAKLKSLNLSGTDINDFSLTNAPWEVSKIEELDFSFCDHITSAGLLNSVPKIKTLQYLALNNVGRGKSVADELFEAAFSLENWKDLEVLSLHFCNRLFSQSLSLLQYCSKLKKISFRTCYHINFASIASNLKYFLNLTALECGSLFSSNEGSSQWIELLKSIGVNCKNMNKLILVNLSGMPIAKVSEYRTIILQFMDKCAKLDTISVLHSEEAIFKLMENCATSSKGHGGIHILTSSRVSIIPPFRHSLDSEINHKRFDKYFGY